MNKCPLENKPNGVRQTERGVHFVHVKTLIEDMKCDVCEVLEACGHINHLKNIEAREKAKLLCNQLRKWKK